MFTKEIILDSGNVVKKPINIKVVYILIFAVLLLIAGIITNFSLEEIINNYEQFFKMLIDMLPPFGNPTELKEYFGYTFEILPELIVTLQISILGTIFGVALSFPVAIIASANISNKYISFIAKFLLSMIRTVPVLVFASLFTFLFGLGEVSGVVAVSLFTFSIATKMFYEIIERADMGPYEAGISSGLSSYKAFLLTIRPQVMPAFYSISLYSLEINVKSATVLGYVNAGGIGILLKDSLAIRRYNQVGLIIFYTIILVVLIDILTQVIRKKMITSHSNTQSSNIKGYIALIFIVILFIWSLLGIDFKGVVDGGFTLTLNIITHMLKPSLDVIFNLTTTGLLYLLLETFMIAILGTFLGTVIAVFLAILGSNNLTPVYVYKPIRIVLSVIRTVPAIIFGIMVIKMTGPGAFAGVVTFMVLSIGMVGKMIIEDIEEVNPGLSEVAEVAGLTWFRKVRTIIWPQIFNSIASIYIYRFEINLRDAATLGLIGAGGIGYPLISSINNQKWNDVGAYLMGLMIIVLIVDYFSTKMRTKLTRG